MMTKPGDSKGWYAFRVLFFLGGEGKGVSCSQKIFWDEGDTDEEIWSENKKEEKKWK